MKSRRCSPVGQDGLCDLRASVVNCVLPACLVSLCLIWAGGCPSKAPQDDNTPADHEAEAGDEIRNTIHEPRVENRGQTTHDARRATSDTYRIVRTWPHDPQAFTQGLDCEDGILYEGTGLYGQSSLTKRNLKTGKLLKRELLPRRYFGEGITVFGEKVIQLTWQSQTGFVYDKTTFRLLNEFKYKGEGWGLTHDGKHLIMSNGSTTLRFLDPNTFAETRRVTVRDDTGPVELLNELEFIDGRIFANVLGSDSIAIIDPNSGRVMDYLDLTNLWPLSQRPSAEHVLNGIAYLPESGHLLVTGKLWPKVYEIELTEQLSERP